tara:strand:- start:2523 stop:2750 length:228 start_codon:yes stop_codon:yes gene_type:complete
MWEDILKNQDRVTQVYNEFKRRNPHLWNEAQQLPGMGEVATLNSIVIKHIKENLGSNNLMETLQEVAEAYILQDR